MSEDYTYLNISVLGNELDESLQAVEEVASATKDTLDSWILLVCLLNLLLVIFKDDPNELYQSYQEGTEGD